MESKTKHVLAAVVLASLMAFVTASGAQAAKCSNATLSGTYEATLAGTVNGLPFAALDLVTSDGNGNITGTGTIVSDGTVIPSTFTATYTVNADCSGSFSSDTGTTENFLVKQDGSEVQIIITGTPLGSATVTGVAKNVASK